MYNNTIPNLACQARARSFSSLPLSSVDKYFFSSRPTALKMASLIRFSNSPQCLSCLKRVTNFDITFHILPFHRQLRGKKKLGKAAAGMVNVQLLEDVPGYGPKGWTALCYRVVPGETLTIPGSVVPIAPGRMRNIFYPRKTAAYLTQDLLRDLKKREVVMERDFTFGMKNLENEGSSDNKDAIDVHDRTRSVNIQINLLPVWQIH